MSEIECYGFSISGSEALKRRHELVKDLGDLHDDLRSGFVGITPTPTGQVVLFRTIKQRDEAFKKFKDIYVSAKKETKSAFVNEKYIKGEAKTEMKDVDPELDKLIQELCDARIEDEMSKLESQRMQINNEVQKYKTEIDRLTTDNASLENIIKELKFKIEEMREYHASEMRRISKELTKAEADMRRMEKNFLQG